MSRPLAISLKRPHEQFALPMPFARRLADVKRGTIFAAMIGCMAACMGVYIYQVTTQASQSFELRQLEKQVERLNDTVASLDYKVTELNSIHALETRIQGMGYVPLSNIRYLQGPGQVAVRK